MAEGDYNAVREAIADILDNDDYDDGSIGPVLVRLAWHASGTYDKATGTGGSNGATMRYMKEAKDEANNGLENARQFLEPIKAKFPGSPTPICGLWLALWLSRRWTAPRSPGSPADRTTSTRPTFPLTDDSPTEPRARTTFETSSTEWVSTTRRLWLSAAHTTWADATWTDPVLRAPGCPTPSDSPTPTSSC